MRALRIALVALLSLSVLDASAAFAKGTGGAAGAGAGGTSGGAPGGGSGSGAGGAGKGSVDSVVFYTPPNDNGHPRRERPRYTPGKEFSACFKQEPLFDRSGNVVANLHGADCFQ